MKHEIKMLDPNHSIVFERTESNIKIKFESASLNFYGQGFYIIDIEEFKEIVKALEINI